jgi:Predicted membrane protein
MTLLLAFLIGFFAGLRSLTAPATTAWAVYMGWLRLERPLSLIGSVPSVIIFTLLAVMELVVDKLPKTPNRTSPVGLIARLLTGGATGACITDAGGQGVFLGGLLGAIGGVVGCFGGYHARKRIVSALGAPDIYVALLEDMVAIAGCLWVVTR